MFWLVAHTRKNGTTGNMNDVSGSGQRVAQSDSVLMFTAEKVDGAVTETTVLFDKLREPPEDHPKPVSFSIVKETDGSRRLVTNLAPGKSETDGRPAEARIIEYLESHAEPQTKEEIRKSLKLSGAKVEDANHKSVSVALDPEADGEASHRRVRRLLRDARACRRRRELK